MRRSSLCADRTSADLSKVHVEPHVLSQKRAVPVGLILNELLTNTFKYAFPDDRKGVVAVHFLKSEETFVLTVRDDGVGMSLPPRRLWRHRVWPTPASFNGGPIGGLLGVRACGYGNCRGDPLSCLIALWPPRRCRGVSKAASVAAGMQLPLRSSKFLIAVTRADGR